MITYTKNEDVFVFALEKTRNLFVSLSLPFCFSPPFTHNPYNWIHFLHI